jgi:hypothetical protein
MLRTDSMKICVANSAAAPSVGGVHVMVVGAVEEITIPLGCATCRELSAAEDQRRRFVRLHASQQHMP